MTIEGHFLIRQLYEDKITYNIVGAAERVLGMLTITIIKHFRADLLIVNIVWD